MRRIDLRRHLRARDRHGHRHKADAQSKTGQPHAHRDGATGGMIGKNADRLADGQSAGTI
jgi:hypothetical protein